MTRKPEIIFSGDTRSLIENPVSYEDYLSNARTLFQSGNLLEAEEILIQLIRQVPTKPMAYYVLGMVYTTAKPGLDRLLMTEAAGLGMSEDPGLLTNIATTLRRDGFADAANEIYEKIITLPNHDMLAWSMYIGALVNQGCPEKGLDLYKRALAAFKSGLLDKDPREDDIFMYHAGLVHLENGLFEDGFNMYDGAGSRCGECKVRTFPKPISSWHGEKVDGDLLLYTEQGVGDEITFLTALREQESRVSGRILVEVNPELVEAYRSADWSDKFVFLPQSDTEGFERAFRQWCDANGVPHAGLEVNAVSIPASLKEEWSKFSFTPDKPIWLENPEFNVVRQAPIRRLFSVSRKSMEDFDRGATNLRLNPILRMYLPALEQVKERLKLDPSKPLFGVAWKGGLREIHAKQRSVTPADIREIIEEFKLNEKYNLISLQFRGSKADCDAAGLLFDQGVASSAKYSTAVAAACETVVSSLSTPIHLRAGLGLGGHSYVPTKMPWQSVPISKTRSSYLYQEEIVYHYQKDSESLPETARRAFKAALESGT